MHNRTLNEILADELETSHPLIEPDFDEVLDSLLLTNPELELQE